MSGTFETTITGAAHASVGYTLGVVVDSLFPKFNPHRSDMQLFLEAVAQFGIGFLAMAESMQVLIPSVSTYVVPIGDGVSNVFFWLAQKHFWQKLDHLTDKMRHKLAKAEHKVVAEGERELRH